MSPIYGQPNYDFPREIEDEVVEDGIVEDGKDIGITEMTMWYTMVLVSIIVTWMLLYFCVRLLALRQKTRNPQQRRPYMGTRSRTSLPPTEPTIYVSPANLPPPPKYEAMAPPSYEEVVGIHYPAYQPPDQPISQPITNALATQSSNSDTNTDTNNAPNETTIETTTVTTVDERRPVAAAT
ncbi:spore coat protein SP85-like isoform X1 [Zerene cesonia]|uniref:spore coat protein SP85-like isoform X1 n=1 Tax=Zerene cesonia TaxID=33412 RepID=UPI0018E57B43|nr:spore coat protein SP85-like isoform X1 [Zerene cesonia]